MQSDCPQMNVHKELKIYDITVVSSILFDWRFAFVRDFVSTFKIILIYVSTPQNGINKFP